MRLGGPITLEQLEAEHTRLVLEDTETREEAARILGIDPSTLYRKRKQVGLRPPGANALIWGDPVFPGSATDSSASVQT